VPARSTPAVINEKNDMKKNWSSSQFCHVFVSSQKINETLMRVWNVNGTDRII
jgi:hypothetical protein